MKFMIKLKIMYVTKMHFILALLDKLPLGQKFSRTEIFAEFIFAIKASIKSKFAEFNFAVYIGI